MEEVEASLAAKPGQCSIPWNRTDCSVGVLGGGGLFGASYSCVKSPEVEEKGDFLGWTKQGILPEISGQLALV